jgi:hypothetical protein
MGKKSVIIIWLDEIIAKKKKGHDQPLAISIKMMERREEKISDQSGD